MSKATCSGPWTVRVRARIRRPAPRRAAARRLAGMFGLSGGVWETLYEDFDLTVGPGQIVAVIGPSGSGKSVLLRKVLAALPGAEAMKTGDLARGELAPIDMVQGQSQGPWLDVLSRCGLAEAAVLVTPARRLSAGQLYRLALARAFWRAQTRRRPCVVVADEFASNLDDDTAAALCDRLRRWVTEQRLSVVVATARAELMEHLRPDQVIVKPLGRPVWSVRPTWRRRGAASQARVHRWPVRLGSIHDYHALASFHYLTGPPAAHKRVYVIRRPRGRRRDWSAAAAPGIAGVLVISPPLIGVGGREVATAGRYSTGDARAAIARLNDEVECISRVIVDPTYRSLGLAVRLVRHALKTSPAAVVEALAVMGRVHPFFELSGMASWYVAGPGKPVYYIHIDATRPLRNRPHALPPPRESHRARRRTSPGRGKPSRQPTDRRASTMTTINEWTSHRPASREELAAMVRNKLSLTLADSSLCSHHDCPLDYLAASFFDQDDLLVWANRGGGKTMLAAAATILDAVFRRPVKIRVLGGSFDQSDRLAEYIREMLAAYPELLAGPFTRRLARIVGGSEIRVLAQSQRAVRGQHVQKIRCDEVDLFDAEVWRAVQFATRSSSAARGSIEVLSTLHRPGGLMQQLVTSARRGVQGGSGYRLIQWCLWEVIERCPPQRPCEGCLLADDCRGVARQAMGFFRIDDAVAIKARSSRAAWEAEMLCRGAARQYMVFDEFDRARHVAECVYQPAWPLYRAIDFGYRSPLVCLWVQLSPAGNVIVLDEYVRSRLPLSRHAEEIRRRDLGPAVATYVDPAGRAREPTSGAACTEMLAAAGIPCTCRPSAIAEGLELIRAALAPAAGDPSLTIHPRCTHLAEAFQSYHYPPPGARGNADLPVKDGPDHLIDALRYFFINRARPRIAIARMRY
ncbi:MAG: AAA family ATPase [Phycisphaerae bacterium]|nr:AAA family ATPase [Phycisphaerae bacterium]